MVLLSTSENAKITRRVCTIWRQPSCRNKYKNPEYDVNPHDIRECGVPERCTGFELSCSVAGGIFTHCPVSQLSNIPMDQASLSLHPCLCIPSGEAGQAGALQPSGFQSWGGGGCLGHPQLMVQAGHLGNKGAGCRRALERVHRWRRVITILRPRSYWYNAFCIVEFLTLR